ncbi:MAG: DNA polymerase IV [Acidobacteriota bacterium]|nr:DNA polymerase IV [Acidobacteriota bacterium]
MNGHLPVEPTGCDNHAVETLCRDCGNRPSPEAETCSACGSARVVRHKELHGLAIAHLDCDAFYATIEKRDRPELRDLPVVVGGHHRGVVAACCYIARAQGVHSAMPMFKALKACPGATVIKPDMRKYAAVGRRVRAMMRNLTPLVEPLSIDEAFMDLSGTEALHGASPATTLAALARRVEEELSITASIGLSYNKFLAKIASDRDKPRGFSVIGRAEARTFLSDKPVSLLWGVGKAMGRRLREDGITLIGELARIDEAELVARYGKIGRRLWLCARGEDDRRVDPESKAKSMSSETTLDRDTAELAGLRPILWQLAETVARRMKKAGIAGRGVTLKLKTADFRIVTRSRRLQGATRSAEELFQAAEPLLVRETDGRAFRLIGIGVHDLVEAGQVVQGELFSGIGSTQSKVDKALDAVREKFGGDAVVKGRGFGIKLERQGPSKVE